MKDIYNAIESELELKLTQRELSIVNYILNLNKENDHTIVRNIRVQGGADLRYYRLVDKLADTFGIKCETDYIRTEPGFFGHTTVIRFTVTGDKDRIEEFLQEVEQQ